jgi:ribosomal protein L7/L12
VNQGLIKRAKAIVEQLKQYLKENEGRLTEEEVDEVLEEIASQMEMIQLLEGS